MPKKKTTRGGCRVGAGRRAFLTNPIRRPITFEERQLKKLVRYAKANGLDGYSAVVRHLIDKYA